MKSFKNDFGFYFLICTLILIMINCGKKADLTLEPELLPQKVTKFKISQVGENIRIRWNYPEFLSDNSSVLKSDRVSKVYIYFSRGNIPDGKFEKKATVLLKTDQKSLSKEGNLYKIDIPFKVKNLLNKNYFFSLKYRYGKKKSPMGKISGIETKIPVQPINDLKISEELKTIVLSWTKPKEDLLKDKIKEISGYNVFRKILSADSPDTLSEFIKINSETIVDNRFEDSDLGVNGTYFYYITIVISKKVFSGNSNTVQIVIKDKYPPDIPGSLAVFKAKKYIFISWSPVKDKDLAFYRIYRKSKDEDQYTLVADKITEHSFKDKHVVKGKKYYYVVTSVDINGNESDNSNSSFEQF